MGGVYIGLGAIQVFEDDRNRSVFITIICLTWDMNEADYNGLIQPSLTALKN